MNDEEGGIRSDLQLVQPAEVTSRWFRNLKLVASSIGLVVRLTASFVAAACEGWVRKQRSLVQKLKDLIVAPSMVVLSSRLSLPSLTEAVTTHRSKKLDSIFQAISKPISKCPPKGGWFPRRLPPVQISTCEPEPEKSVHVEVLHDPSPEAIKADIIFIHGLHGSLYNTWKQGLWGHRKQVQNLPLKHKYKVEENPETAERFRRKGKNGLNCDEEKLAGGRQQSGSNERELCDIEYDHLLENITDLINNIDDKIKESKNGKCDSGTDFEKEPYSPCWPRDWLPKDCPGMRVIAVNYTTDPFLWRPVWVNKRIRSSMTQRSQQMEDILLEMGVGEKPVVWVGHSKGGLFVKQMLVDARNSKDPRLSRLLRQTKGIMFYSVPHRGSSLAHWNLPLLRQSIELTEVQKDCPEVLILHEKFMKLFEEKSLTAEVFSFVETILTFMFVTNVRVVSVDSADVGLGSFQGVNIDHREICKPLNRDCFLYKELTNLIARVASGSTTPSLPSGISPDSPASGTGSTFDV